MNERIAVPFPYVGLDTALNIVEYNSVYKKWVEGFKDIKTIFDLMPEFDADKAEQRALIGEKYYDLYTMADGEGINVIFIENPYINSKGMLCTNILIGMVIIDNSIEIQETMDEIRYPHFCAIIERKINDYFNNLGGFVRKYESGKYLFVLNKDTLAQLKEDKFSLVETIGKLDMGNDVPATLSIGIGMNGNTVNESMAYARGALDLALGRGGNQIVIKESEDSYQFFGGDGEESHRSRWRRQYPESARSR